MKITSWNVNGIRAAYKKGFLDFWEKHNADILCLQETKCQKEQLTPDMINPYDFESHWSSAEKKGYSGTATFSRHKILSVEHGIHIPKFDSEGRFVISQHKDFKIYNIYFPNGARGPDRHAYKMEFLETLSAHLKPQIQSGVPIIVLGDYNIAPTDIDIYDPKKHARTSGFLPEEKNWFQSFLDLGFVDTFRLLHPDEKHRYSWWNQIERARIGNRGWRIDLICVSKNIQSVVKKAEILDEIEGSDHCPVSITLDI